jgi:formylglycine-generating enzyme required for sulfatase activity
MRLASLLTPLTLILLVGCSEKQAAEPTRTSRPKPKGDPPGMKFVRLPAATFYMGGGGGKAGKKTEIKEDFEIAIHTVTQGQWQAVMGNNPSMFSRDGAGVDEVKDIKDEDLKQFPVENVSWNDTQEFIKKLNEKEKGKGYHYRLPTEAEWEYACRGGATSEEECSYHFYLDKPTNVLSSEKVNCDDSKLQRKTKVGTYPSNKLGLYDMHGNVWQWCEDLYEGGPARVLRGGSFCNCAPGLLASYRHNGTIDERRPSRGFRLVRVWSVK